MNDIWMDKSGNIVINNEVSTNLDTLVSEYVKRILKLNTDGSHHDEVLGCQCLSDVFFSLGDKIETELDLS